MLSGVDCTCGSISKHCGIVSCYDIFNQWFGHFTVNISLSSTDKCITCRWQTFVSNATLFIGLPRNNPRGMLEKHGNSYRDANIWRSKILRLSFFHYPPGISTDPIPPTNWPSPQWKWLRTLQEVLHEIHTIKKARCGSVIFLSPHQISPFSCGVVYMHARVLLALLSLRKNGDYS